MVVGNVEETLTAPDHLDALAEALQFAAKEPAYVWVQGGGSDNLVRASESLRKVT